MSTVQHPVYGFHLGNGKIRYVGITTDFGSRMASHKHAAQSGNFLPLYRWIRKHGWSNISVEILQTVENVDLLKLAEVDWIEYLGTCAYDGLGGLNCTRGGDGVFGYQYTEEQRADRSRRMSAQNKNAEMRAAQEEGRKKSSYVYPRERVLAWADAAKKANTGRPKTKEHTDKVQRTQRINRMMKNIAVLDVPADPTA